MTRTLLLTIALLGFSSIDAPAAPHTLQLDLLSVHNGSFDFDRSGVYASSPVGGASLDDPHALFRPFESGLFEAAGGPLQAFVPGDSYSSYQYGPGVFTFSALWSEPGGAARSGGFSLALLSPLAFGVNENSSSYPGQAMSDFPSNMDVDLGRGVMDSELAAYLGVGPQILGGTLSLYVYGIDGAAADAFRHGQIYTGASRIEVTVPEPGTAALSLLALAVLGRRLRPH